MWFSSLLPSWRFFDDLIWVPTLLYRPSTEDPWAPALPPIRVRWISLFVFPAGLKQNALMNVVEHLANHPGNSDDVLVLSRHFGSGQFKIVGRSVLNGEERELFISGVF